MNVRRLARICHDENVEIVHARSRAPAWVGLGADGLSSSCYGPEEAFLALGQYTHLAIYLAIAYHLTLRSCLLAKIGRPRG